MAEFNLREEYPEAVDVGQLVPLDKSKLYTAMCPSEGAHHAGDYVGRLLVYTNDDKRTVAHCALYSTPECNYVAAYTAATMKAMWDNKIGELMKAIKVTKARLDSAEAILKLMTFAKPPYDRDQLEYEMWQDGFTGQELTRHKPNLTQAWHEGNRARQLANKRLAQALDWAQLYNKEYQL